MIGSDCEGMDDIDTLQRSIKRIVQGYINEIKILQKDLLNKEIDNKRLTCVNEKITQQLKNYEDKSKNCTCLALNNFCLPRKDSQFEALQDDVLKEVEDISSLQLDSQFVSDSDELIMKEKKMNSYSSANVLEKFFTIAGESNLSKESPLKVINDTILVDESPTSKRFAATTCLFVPETMPQNFNEKTPCKLNVNRLSANGNIQIIPDSDNKLSSYDSPKSSPVIRLTSSDKLMADGRIPFNFSQLISPSRRLNNSPSRANESSTPKRNLFSSKQSKSPKRSRTPRKKITSLKTSNRMETDYSLSGVRKLTQTQLNIACFKKFRSNENVPAVCNASIISPIKNEPKDTTDHEGEKCLKPSTPLNSLENSPDPNETNLSLSAIKRVADDVDLDVKPVLSSSYDRIPEPIPFEGRKALRKRLPGLECPDCIKYYETFGRGNEKLKQRILDRCSRHRTKNVDLNCTPEGFWKPMITQTPR